MSETINAANLNPRTTRPNTSPPANTGRDVPVRTYSTCAFCGDRLDVPPTTPPGYMVHQECPPATDPLSLLRASYLNAVERGADDAELTELEQQLDAYDDRAPQLEAAALLYATWGWPVFPVAPGLKRPATEHGLKEATTDADQIKAWWWRWPRANVGVATGHAFDVIDIDPDGIHWWRRHGHEHGPLPDIHGKVSTPRTVGMHLYVKPTGMRNKAGLAPGVDYRGKGGYVLVPPSVLTPAAYDHKRNAPPPRLATHPVYSWTVYPSPEIKPSTHKAGDE
jgi:hypothetical protein